MILSFLHFAFFNMPQYYNVLNFPHDEYGQGRKGRSSAYRWEEIPVGAGFKLTFKEMKENGTKTKPSLPDRLRNEGVKFQSVRLKDGYLFKRIS